MPDLDQASEHHSDASSSSAEAGPQGVPPGHTLDISVAIPCYNSAKYLRASLDSIAAQTYPIREIIVLNDGSTDHSVAIAEEFAATQPEGKVRIISQPNQGIGRARTNAIAEARFSNVITIDADDTLHPQAAEWWAAYAQQNPHYALIYGDYYTTDEAGNVTGLIDHTQRRSDPLEGDLVATILWENVAGGCNFYRREPVLEVGGFVMDPPEFSSDRFQDVILNYRLLLAGYPIGYVHRPVYYYRDTPGSMSKTRGVGVYAQEELLTFLFGHYSNRMARAFCEVRAWRAEQLRDAFATLEARDTRIHELEGEIGNARRYQRDMEEVIADRNRHLNAYISEIGQARAYQDHLESEISTARDYQARLEAEIETARNYQAQMELHVQALEDQLASRGSTHPNRSNARGPGLVP